MGSPSTAVSSASLAAARATAPPAHRAMAVWLLVCCALVLLMVVVGGVTRLTHSGLSITEWQPIVGALPPLSEQDWQAAFAKYQATPEYQLVNRGMSLGEFERIFWWEYAHRLLGRLIGVAFLLPLLWFALRRAIPKGYGGMLGAIFVLGALQGALGWYMVQSGLVDEPSVSQFRLTAHLALAFALFGAMLWIAMSLLESSRARPVAAPTALRRTGAGLAALVFVMVMSGGLVAGIRAGFAYNTFPLMNGHVVPPETLMLAPWWKNFFYNMATVQLDHRLLALAVTALALVAWRRVHRAPEASRRARIAANLVLAMLAVQVGLGIATVLLVVPLPLAAAHQAGAVLLFALALNLAHALRGRGGESEGS
ncbi:MAG TPA: COX15/CtaA family protein [Casimicrobiaceae bacterium]|nr:COX15/CtaA family protein [Casimicrobiaceae bacterium]